MGACSAMLAARGAAAGASGRLAEVSDAAAAPQRDPRPGSAWTGRDRGGTVAALVLPHRVAVLDAVLGERRDITPAGCRAATIQAALRGAEA